MESFTSFIKPNGSSNITPSLFLVQVPPFQLAAGGLDFVAHFPPDGGAFAVAFQDVLEEHDFFPARRIELDVLGAIDGDQVEVTIHISYQAAQFFCILPGRVHVFDEDIFKSHAAAGFLEIVLRRLDNVFDFKMPARGHDVVADGIIRRVKGNGQGDGKTFVSQAINLRDDAAGGKGDIS